MTIHIGPTRCFPALWLVVALAPPCLAQNDSDSNDAPQSYANIVAADTPAFWWRFEEAKVALGEIVGKVTLNVAGPRKERFPKFDDKNAAAQFVGGSGRIVVKDAGENSPLDFDAGDAITLEAWVNPAKLASGQTVYVVGKGRTGNDGVAKDNQNYALRLVGDGGKAGLSFLFRGASNTPAKTEDWHRWDSLPAFAVGSGWHYVAVTYAFGQKDSLRGYIDGKEVKGKWKGYGGATDEGPVVDDDELWIGSSMGGSSGSSFTGELDEVAIYRSALPAERIAARYQAVQPKPYITSVPIPRDRVLVEILENIPDGNSWDFIPPSPIERTDEPALALVELPRKYNEHGVRADRTNPLVVWMTTDIELPTGPQRLLLRSRNAARLYLDGKLVIDNPFPKSRSDGHNSLHIVKSDVSPNIRPVQPGDQENVTELKIAPGIHRLKLELFGGGKSKRIEFGELGLYIAPADSDDFRLVAHETHWQDPLTDDGWLAYETRRRGELTKINQERRGDASQEYAAYWERRHAWAREVVSTPSISSVKSIDEFAEFAAKAAGKQPLPLTDDWSFVRRVYVDLIGVIPTAAQAEAFVKDTRPDKRARLIDELLEHPGWADNWVGYWQDVLAENPNIVN
ncbi:MAG: LamG-like jellyroll fold domain-containing protein, partial [Pirellulaceae bacterium]